MDKTAHYAEKLASCLSQDCTVSQLAAADYLDDGTLSAALKARRSMDANDGEMSKN